MANHLSYCVALEKFRQYLLVWSSSEAILNLVEEEIEKLGGILLDTGVDWRNEGCQQIFRGIVNPL